MRIKTQIFRSLGLIKQNEMSINSFKIGNTLLFILEIKGDNRCIINNDIYSFIINNINEILWFSSYDELELYGDFFINWKQRFVFCIIF